MNFELTAEQQDLQQAARRFAQGELMEFADTLERENQPPSREVAQQMGKLGFLGINLPKEYGGMGRGHLDAIVVLEEFTKVSSAVAHPVFEALVGPVRTVLNFGSQALRERVLPAVCRGELVVAVAMSEPHAGSALTDLTTKAVVSDDGKSVTVSGAKRWCSGGGHADGYVVYCRFNDKPGAGGIGAVYIDNGAPGLTFGKREELLGFRGIPSADLYFDDVTVPSDQIIVRPPNGFKQLMEEFDLERCGNATNALGNAQAALDDAVQWVQEREQFGKPIADFQAVQLKLADMLLKVEASRLLIYRAVERAGAGNPSILHSSVGKCFANEMSRDVCLTGLQLMGGYGYSKEYRMERRLRDSIGWGIAGGTIDIQKINIAAAMMGRRFNQRA